jgi:hypothetical protein
MDKKTLQKFYLEYLKEEGYETSLTKSGDICFKREDDNYYLVIDENDEVFFRLYTGYTWEVHSENEITKAFFVANYINSDYKSGKMYLDMDQKVILFTVDLLLANPDDFKSFFERCLETIQTMIDDFFDKMDEVNDNTSE